MSDDLAVQLIGIEKRFPGVIANHDVNISVKAGTIHAIVGENGAGKSTLMKTLYGMHRPEKGQVIVNGVEQHFKIAERRDRRRDRHGPPALHVGRQLHGHREHHPRRRTRSAAADSI